MTAVAEDGHRLITWGAVAGWLFDCLLALLVFLSLPALQTANLPPAAIPRPNQDWAADFPDRVERVTTALAGLPLPLPTPLAVPQGSGVARWVLRRYEITMPKPQDLGQVAALFAAATNTTAGASITAAAENDGAKIQIGIDGLLTHTIMLHWLGRNPQLAILITDLGDNLLEARLMADLDAPLTFAIRPGQSFSNEVTQLAALFQRETLLQLSTDIESGGRRSSPPGAKAGHGTTVGWLQRTAAAAPNAVGLYATDAGLLGTPEQLRSLLADAKQKQWRTFVWAASSDPAICQAAAAAGLACTPRLTVLDGSAEADQITALFGAVIDEARTRGTAIIALPGSDASLVALRVALPKIAAAGIDVVPVSVAVANLNAQ